MSGTPRGRGWLWLTWALLLAARTALAANPVAPAGDGSVEQLHPQIVHGESGYLVVWQEGDDYRDTAGGDLYLARLDEQGRVGTPQALSTAAETQSRPRVAWNGSHYLVVWQDLRNGRDWDVYAARVDAGGKVLDPDGIRVAGGEHNQALPVVSPAGAGFLVVWQSLHADGFYRLQAARIDAEGKAGEPHAIRYTGKARPELWGYTPGWGYNRMPLRVGEDRPALLTGGQPELVRVADAWLLSWIDESNWGVGADIITRRFARLENRDGRWNATRILRAPNASLGVAGGRFAAGADAQALYAGWGSVGRGQMPGTAALVDARSLEFLPNPNEPIERNFSGWTTDSMLALFLPGAPVTATAVAYGHGGYLVAAPAYAGNRAELPTRIIAARLTPGARRLDTPPHWPVLHRAERPLGNLALAAGARGFVLVFEQEDAAGRRRIHSQLLTTTLSPD